MRTSDQIQEIAKAMSQAQSQMNCAGMSGTNTFFKTAAKKGYSDISDIWNAIRPVLAPNELTVWQDATTENGCLSVTTRICHSSGQWVEFGPLSIPLVKMDAHSIASAITYAKRYTLSAALGVVSGEDDDDGNKAQGKDEEGKDTAQPAKAQPEAPKAVLSPERIAYIKKSFLGAPDSIKANISSFLAKHSLTLDTLSDQAAARVEEALKL